MTWSLVARKDFEDAVRSRMIWAAIGVFVLLMVIISIAAASGNLSDSNPTDIIVMFTNIGGELLIPIIALMVGYMAIVGERQSGSLRVLFGLTHNRRDVFVGKLTSRLGVILFATLVSCVAAVVMALALFGTVQVSTFLGFIGITLLLGAAFTGIAVAVSAMTESRMTAMGGAIGSYVLFVMLWHPLAASVYYAVNGKIPGLKAPGWYFFLLRLNPLEAYAETASSLTNQFIYGIFGWQNVVENIPDSALRHSESLLLSSRLGGHVSFYLSNWFAAVTMLIWIAVPAVIGYRKFSRADLN